MKKERKEWWFKRLANAEGNEALLPWVDLLRAVPKEWFFTIETDPMRIPVKDLPFPAESLAEIEADKSRTLRFVIRRALAMRNDNYIAQCHECGEEVVEWLVNERSHSKKVEAHLRNCPRCRKIVPQAANGLSSTRMFSTKLIKARLASVGLEIQPIED